MSSSKSDSTAREAVDGDSSFRENVIKEARRKSEALNRLQTVSKKRRLVDVAMEIMDVRKHLFSSIPEPYHEVTSFQRVIITEPEAADEADSDRHEAGTSLKVCSTYCSMSSSHACRRYLKRFWAQNRSCVWLFVGSG
jgi:hypothetical protein